VKIAKLNTPSVSVRSGSKRQQGYFCCRFNESEKPAFGMTHNDIILPEQFNTTIILKSPIIDNTNIQVYFLEHTSLPVVLL